MTAIGGMAAGCGGGQANFPDSTAAEQAAAQAAGTAAPRACCKGMNECRGKGNCKTAQNQCKGKNDCRALGGCKAVDCK